MVTLDNSLPESIGPYRVTGHLGRGGMGEVFQGHDDRLDRPVALKRVRPGHKDPKSARQRFRREARAVARLSDSAIVQVYDWLEVDNQDWLVMELVNGRPLSQVLAEGRPSLSRTLHLIREIASGLTAAHDAGLVHRDLKASNVMVCEGTGPDRVKILDFGIAKTLNLGQGQPLSTLTMDGQVVGTVSSMSPEQALGQPVGPRSDLFSLGVLFYEMLTGKSPFAGRNSVETLSRICSWQQTPLHQLDPTIPTKLTQFVDHLLEKDPKQRPTNARWVIAKLDEVGRELEDEPLRDPAELQHIEQTTWLESEQFDVSTSSTPPKRRRLIWIGCGVALVITLWISISRLNPLTGSGHMPNLAATSTSLTRHDLYQRAMTSLERYDQEGRIDSAIDDFQRALALDGNFAPALAGLSRAYGLDARNGNKDPIRRDQAVATARRAVGLGEHLAVARISLGLAYIDSGSIESAEAELKRAIQIEPLNADAWLGLGKVAEMRSDPAAAEAHYRKAVALRPDVWTYHSKLGVLLYHAGRYDDAEEAFLRSLEQAPDNYLTFRNLGGVHFMQGRLSEAASRFQQALEIRPSSSVYNNLGTIYFSQGLYQDAVSTLRKAVESGGASFHYIWGNLADAYRWTPDNHDLAQQAYRRAIQLIDEEIDDRPNDPTLHTRRILYLAKSGECRHLQENLSELAGDNGSAWYRLAVSNEVCDRRDAALAALETALKQGFSRSEIQSNPELLKLRKDVRYHQLVMRPSAP